MSILFDVPKIGKEESEYGQKGPTCWYYVAKMMLRFHERLDKSGDIYAQFKVLHELRKVLSGLDDTKKKDEAKHGLGEEARKVDRELLNLSRMVNELEFQLDPEIIEVIQYFQNRTSADATASAQRLQRIERAIKKLDSYEGNSMSRLKLLSTFVPNAGFEKIDVSQGSTPEELESLLKSRGPLYGGGGLSTVTGRTSATGIETAKGERILGVYELNPESHHAVLLIGISNQMVYYKDPNRTDEVRSISYHVLFGKIRQEGAGLIGLACDTGMRAGQCQHVQTKQMKAP